MYNRKTWVVKGHPHKSIVDETTCPVRAKRICMTTILVQQSNKWKERNQARQIISDMIGREYQIEVETELGHYFIFFNKGNWQVFDKDTLEETEVTDTGGTIQKDTLRGAFINARIDIHRGKSDEAFYETRTAPAEAICDYLDFKIKLSEYDEVKITVHLPGRNGYISPNGEITVGKKDW